MKSRQINRQKNAATHSRRTPSEGHTGSRKKQNGEFPSLEEVLQLEDFTELRVTHEGNVIHWKWGTGM